MRISYPQCSASDHLPSQSPAAHRVPDCGVARRRNVHGVVLSALSAIGSILLGAPGAAAQPRYVDSAGVVRNHTTGGTRGGGFYSIFAEAYDNRAIPQGDSDLKAGAYPAPPFTNSTRVVSAVGGAIYTPSAQAQINTFTRSFLGLVLTDGWDSTGSYATIGRNGPTGTNPAEFARANSRVNDPNSYEVLSGQESVTFSLVFGAGTRLSASADEFEMSSASISGNQDTSLLLPYLGSGNGNLFNFGWSLSSASPGSTQFMFTSNPALGLNDVAIRSEFMSNISSSGGGFALMDDFVIQATISAAAGTVYTYGGLTDYSAEISAVPAPGAVALGGLGLLVITPRRRRDAA